MDWKYVLVLQVAATVCTLILASHEAQPRALTATFNFHYDADTGFFVGANRLTCILVLLDEVERHDVHTSHGIHNIELELLRNWMGVLPEVMVFRQDSRLSSHILHWCDNRQIIMLKRTPETFTSTVPTSTPTFPVAQTSISQRVESTYTFPSTPSGVAGSGLETTISPTTTEPPASATSQRAVKVTAAVIWAPYIIYDNASSVNAVIVDRDTCFVYTLSDMEAQMIHIGPDIRNAFEKTLLARDRSAVTTVYKDGTGTSDIIRQKCRAGVFKLD